MSQYECELIPCILGKVHRMGSFDENNIGDKADQRFEPVPMSLREGLTTRKFEGQEVVGSGLFYAYLDHIVRQAGPSH